MDDAAEAFAAAVRLQEAGRWQDAAEHYRQAIKLDGVFGAAFAGLGHVSLQLGNNAEALFCCRRAIEIDPTVAEWHYTLGLVWQSLDQNPEAARSYRRAVELRPRFSEAIQRLGFVMAGEKMVEATRWFEDLARLRPDDIEIQMELGKLRLAAGKMDEAVGSFRQAVDIEPNENEALLCLANALNCQGKLDEAVGICTGLLERDAALPDAYAIRGDSLTGIARLSDAIADYRRALELAPHNVEVHEALLHAVYFCPGVDAAAIYAEHRRFDARFTASLAESVQPHPSSMLPSRRLRIGYVSGHFRNHCQMFFTTPLLSHHDRRQFEVFCYSKTPRNDQVTELVRSLADQWRDIGGLTDAQAAEWIRRDGIDVLVDLAMHMQGGSPLVFGRKPAPVQVCWLAYPGTTGLSAIDYRITDPHLDPPGMFDELYSERSVRLPHTFWCYDPLSQEPQVGSLPALANGYVTFGCLNNFCKVNEETLKLWGTLMRGVGRSRLLLLAPEGSAREWVLDILTKEGIEAERITFVHFQPRMKYLATYGQIDVGLETLPYNGHTTSMDAHWMGVPVPTVVGKTAVGRAGVSLLRNLGLDELIAETTGDYVEMITRLANDVVRLSELRSELRQRMQRSPLMDGPGFARAMEAAYRKMWERWCGADR
jgi:protein O-GlcNAc transferase